LSVPAEGMRSSGRPAHSGVCSRRRLRTRSASISISSVCIFVGMGGLLVAGGQWVESSAARGGSPVGFGVGGCGVPRPTLDGDQAQRRVPALLLPTPPQVVGASPGDNGDEPCGHRQHDDESCVEGAGSEDAWVHDADRALARHKQAARCCVAQAEQRGVDAGPQHRPRLPHAPDATRLASPRAGGACRWRRQRKRCSARSCRPARTTRRERTEVSSSWHAHRTVLRPRRALPVDRIPSPQMRLVALTRWGCCAAKVPAVQQLSVSTGVAKQPPRA
jgi:hypothetical protein